MNLIHALPDLLALAWFCICWFGYNYIDGQKHRESKSLLGMTFAYRRRWSREMIRRTNNMIDTTLLGNLMRSVSFYANTTIFINAGIVAMLGGGGRAADALHGLPFAREVSETFWEVKALLLLSIFVYAWIKLSWALRQMNIMAILMGCLPSERAGDQPEDLRLAEMITRVNSAQAIAFNKGETAYYFGLAALSWFIQPWLFIGATALVVYVLARRDFTSEIRDILAAGAADNQE